MSGNTPGLWITEYKNINKLTLKKVDYVFDAISEAAPHFIWDMFPLNVTRLLQKEWLNILLSLGIFIYK